LVVECIDKGDGKHVAVKIQRKSYSYDAQLEIEIIQYLQEKIKENPHAEW
jgi:hypothetical protein